jgi:hypothetical protein
MQFVGVDWLQKVHLCSANFNLHEWSNGPPNSGGPHVITTENPALGIRNCGTGGFSSYGRIACAATHADDNHNFSKCSSIPAFAICSELDIARRRSRRGTTPLDDGRSRDDGRLAQLSRERWVRQQAGRPDAITARLLQPNPVNRSRSNPFSRDRVYARAAQAVEGTKQALPSAHLTPTGAATSRANRGGRVAHCVQQTLRRGRCGCQAPRMRPFWLRRRLRRLARIRSEIRRAGSRHRSGPSGQGQFGVAGTLTHRHGSAIINLWGGRFPRHQALEES